MLLKAIFNKPIDRPIEGVIKADDEASLRVEIEEYVLTNEVEKRLESFLDAYNNYEGANGVWISGFFGSGKSHLLKILALVLENRQIDGIPVLDLFLPKCGENEILRGDLKRAIAISSKSILFNIDQKADVISKSQIDALLSVFVKVFDEMCGYYGKQRHIAQFERDLDSRGLYEQFKSSYASIAGRSWQKGREQALFEAKNIAQAYAETTGDHETQAMGILDKYDKHYSVSIEDFAQQVQAYIERQDPNFRLNFFVDEVGQYIAGNVKLMTNLQTIAESLATKCRGRAWVIVTAQEDMGTVVGEMDKQQGNDFSKIQARFANRMKLTSADVAEVIQKRLLTKTEEGVRLLSDMYHAQVDSFKTLFDFADGSQTYRNFQDRDHFIHSYPFIPYQFALFQSAIQNLSQHNAFEGKHSSVGERSMLGVFQQVAIEIGKNETGQLATFDLMFDGIRTALKSSIQRAVNVAEKHLDKPFAVRLLKALFLVKYVKEFKPTIRNLCVLMLDRFNQDLPELKKNVEEALGLLEQQTYVQRNGDLYEYLTDEEKDIEQEIKNTDVNSTDLAAELDRIIFDRIIKQKKIRYSENGHDYAFARKLDGRLYGREYELAIHVISPFHENSDNEAVLRMQSTQRGELLVVMPEDERLVRDLLMYKRTEKYTRQNMSITQSEAVRRILTSKGDQNRERHTELEQRAKDLIAKARLFAGGSELEVASGDAQTRVEQGFYSLIALAYPNLRMLRGIVYAESDVARYLKHAAQSLPGSDTAESEQEMLAFIHNNRQSGLRSTVKNLLERFERSPYGWYREAILCTLAKLCAHGKVEACMDGNLLEEDKLASALCNSRNESNIVLEPQLEFTASQVRGLKDFFGDFFDTPPQASDAKALGKETSAAFQVLMDKLARFTDQTAQYPFLQALMPVLDTLKKLGNKPYAWHLTELAAQEDALLEMKEKIIDPICKFMHGPQKEIFDDASGFIKEQEPNFAYINGDEAAQVSASMADPECFRGNRMQQMKTQLDALQSKVSAQVEAEIAKAKAKLAGLEDRLSTMAEFRALSKEQQRQVTLAFDECSVTMERQHLIAVIRDTLRRFEENDYPRLLSQITSWAHPAPSPEPAPQTDGSGTAKDEGASSAPVPPAKAEAPIEYIPSRAVDIAFDKPCLIDESDVDNYLASMRKALLAEIRKGKRIQI